MKRLEMKSKHPLAIRRCHWVNFPLLALMIWSGLWIYWANDIYRCLRPLRSPVRGGR